MRYGQMLKIAGIDRDKLDANGARAGAIDAAISDLSCHAFFPDAGSRHLATSLAAARVKRRVAKRWARRLLVEGLPRSARLTGPRRSAPRDTL